MTSLAEAAARREAEALQRLWGWRVCDRCGETIILGEEVFRLRRDGSSEELCSPCAAAPASAPSVAPVRVLLDGCSDLHGEARDAA
jgi:hypothetical protein